MTDATGAYSMPASLEAELSRVYDHWQAIRRGGNAVPFSDDVKLASLGKAGHDAGLIDVFENPLRFRLGLLGRSMAARLGGEPGGKFLDKVALQAPFDHFEAQCAATVRSRAPTYFRHGTPPPKAYARIVLPLWGNGRIDTLLVATTSIGAG
jgi:hypothetical protein